MKYENALTIFIFSLVANLFLFLVTKVSSFPIVRKYGGVLVLVSFMITLAGLFIASFKQRALSSTYYVALFLVSLFALIMQILRMGMSSLTQLFFVLAILVALLISLLDFRRLLIIQEKMLTRAYMQINELRYNTKALMGEVETLKKTIESKQAELDNKKNNLKQAKTEMVELKKKSNSTLRDVSRNNNLVANLNKKIEGLQNKTKSVVNQRKAVSALKADQKKLQNKLVKSQKEVNYQAELKGKYSKTIRNIKKHKKEEEELLVVSSDGKSVHKPKCIVVRNVPKEHRKLMKNWKLAQKQGLKGCKLCSPHTKEKVIKRGTVSYRFVASKESDKIHTVSCLQVKNIDNKDKIYFRNYKQALKKGYTACRICNSGSQ